MDRDLPQLMVAEKSIAVKPYQVLPAKPVENTANLLTHSGWLGTRHAKPRTKAVKSAGSPAPKVAFAQKASAEKPSAPVSLAPDSPATVKPQEVIALDDTEFGKY